MHKSQEPPLPLGYQHIMNTSALVTFFSMTNKVNIILIMPEMKAEEIVCDVVCN
jgi:hypothetical protein